MQLLESKVIIVRRGMADETQAELNKEVAEANKQGYFASTHSPSQLSTERGMVVASITLYKPYNANAKV